VTLHARRAGKRLLLDVLDDGLGPTAPARLAARNGNGVALANLRERLASRFAGDASLDIAPANPGTRATIEIPYFAASATPPQSHR
jgi:LytS/YehU family sensor histidine kinase